jgi:hypothetical protein
VLKKLSPDIAKKLDPIANQLGSGVGHADDAYTMAAKLLANAVQELAAQDAQTKLKESPIDVNAPTGQSETRKGGEVAGDLRPSPILGEKNFSGWRRVWSRR